MSFSRYQNTFPDPAVLVYFVSFRIQFLFGTTEEIIRRYQPIRLTSAGDKEFLVRRLKNTVERFSDRSLAFSRIDVRFVSDIDGTTYMIDGEGVLMKNGKQSLIRPGAFLDISEFLENRRV